MDRRTVRFGRFLSHRYRALPPLLAVGLVVTTAACGSSGTSQAGASADTPTLQIVLGNANPIFMDALVAQTQGYFKQADVNVEFSYSGSTDIARVAAGQKDLAFTGTPGALAPTAQGHPTQIVYAWAVGSPIAVIVKQGSRFKTLDDLSGQTVGVQGAGTLSYGTALYYSHLIQQAGGKPLKVVAINDQPTINNEVISGQLAATMAPESSLVQNLAAHQVRVLVSPQSAQSKQEFGDLIASSVWGLKSDIAKKKVTITRFLSAIRRGDQYVHSHSAAQIAKAIEPSPVLQGFSLSDIETSVEYNLPYAAPTLGNISQSAWEASLAQFKTWSLGLNLSSSPYSYNQVINMAPLKAAS